MLSFTLVTAPTASLTGITVSKLQRFRTQHWVAWCLLIAGLSAFTIVHADTQKVFVIVLTVVISIGCGILLCAW